MSDALGDALEQLSEAHGPAALIRAMGTVQRLVRRKRQTEGVGPFASSIMEAIEARDRMKAAGMPAGEVSRAFEGVVRDVWPKPQSGREAAWRTYCQHCNDTGYIWHTCTVGARCKGTSTRLDGPKEPGGRYLRLCARAPESAYEHDYVEICTCAQGDRHRPKQVTEFDALDRAAQPVRKPSRFGR